jgi:hypothetical protein
MGAEDNDGRLGDPNPGTFGRDLRNSTATPGNAHSSPDIVTKKDRSLEHTGSYLPAERLSSSSILQTTIRENMSSSRKRAVRSDDDPFSVDESMPIIRHAQGGAKDYNSISPSISARTSGVENGSSTRPGAAGRTGEAQQVGRDQIEEAERHAAEQERKESSRWRKFLDKYGSVELDNKGSVARDHLALGKSKSYNLTLSSHFIPSRW